MRKFATLTLGSILLFVSCQKTDSVPEEQTSQNITERACATQEVLMAHLQADPGLAARMSAIEVFTRQAIADRKTERAGKNTITIPVVVHVLYRTAEENISDAQIQSQIDVLNEDFNLDNADNTLVPDEFDGVKADVGVRFVLDRVIRKETTRKSWAFNDAMKFSRMGGSDAVDPANYLNMWSCNLGLNLLGYAQFPGGDPASDGVVILYSAFGRTGTLIPNYDKGRTATHEVGHWLNLRHIWGDATCGNDFVDDTPLHNAANTGCPPAGHTSTCTGNPLEMWMNYMDYTYDGCMYMFSSGQKDRMMATFVAGGPRSSFAD
jgi:hypothetical protein